VCVCERACFCTAKYFWCSVCSSGTFEDNGICVQCPTGSFSSTSTVSLSANNTELLVCKCHASFSVHLNTSSPSNASNDTSCYLQSVDGSCAGECATTWTFWTLEELFSGNGVTLRTQKVIQGGDNGHVGRPCEVSLAPPCPELFCELRGHNSSGLHKVRRRSQ
jgi:hypothetical protein